MADPSGPASYGLCIFVALVGGCSTPPQGPPQKATAGPDPQLELALQRFRAPFQTDQTIVADHLEIEMSANFFGTEFGQPSVDRNLHDATQRLGQEADDYLWVNRAGGTTVPLKLAIGKQNYIVLKDARLKVLSASGKITLKAHAAGEVRVLEGKSVRPLQELRIVDGVVHSR